MKVNSTGLGKTTMVAHFANLSKVEDNGSGKGMVLNIEATEPVHWSIKATVGGEDLRTFAKLLLRPSILFRAVWLVCFGRASEPPEKK
jgi:hypothetical protein